MLQIPWKTCSPLEEKILGVSWNFTTDHLIFDVQCISGAAVSQPMRVSVATRFYDPLWILTPFMIQFKMLFRARHRMNPSQENC